MKVLMNGIKKHIFSSLWANLDRASAVSIFRPVNLPLGSSLVAQGRDPSRWRNASSPQVRVPYSKTVSKSPQVFCRKAGLWCRQEKQALLTYTHKIQDQARHNWKEQKTGYIQLTPMTCRQQIAAQSKKLSTHLQITWDNTKSSILLVQNTSTLQSS